MTRRSLLALAAAGAVTALAGPASAGGITVPRPGGLNFTSPVEGTPGAFWWNPAALGLMEGLHIGADVAATFASGKYTRTVDPNGMVLPDTMRYGEMEFSAFSPAPFLGVSYGLPRLAFGVGVFVPFGRGIEYPGTEEAAAGDPTAITDALSPGRSHLIKTDLKHFYLTPGLSVEVVRDTLWVGATFNVIYSTFLSWLTVDRASGEDVTLQATSRIGTVCAGTTDADGICTPAADGTVSKTKPLTALDFGFTAGLLLQPTDAAKLGISISSGSKVHYEGTGLFTTPAALGSMHYEGDMDLTYKLPWTFNVGAQYKLKRKLEIDLWYTFQNYQVHEDFLICVGTADEATEERTAGSIARCTEDAADNDPIAVLSLNKPTVRYRGYKASHSVAVGVAYPVVEDLLKVGLNVMYESSSVPKEAVTVASLDSRKLDFLLAVAVSPTPWLDINVGGNWIYAFPFDNTVDENGDGTAEGLFRRSFDDCTDTSDPDRPVCGTEEFGPGEGKFKFGIWRVGVGLTFKLFTPKVKKAEFHIPPTVGPATGPATAPATAPETAPAPAPATAPAPAPAPAP